MGTTYSGADWFAADTFLRAGRNPNHRRFGKTRLMWRIEDGPSDGDIHLRLHETDIVTYHHDGTQTIYMGGWNTVTTKRDINQHSAARIYGVSARNKRILGEFDNVLGVYHSSDPLAAPRVQKCRICHGTGEVVDRCSGVARQRWGDRTMDAPWRELPGMRRSTSHQRRRYEWERDDENVPQLVDEMVTVVTDATPRRPTHWAPGCEHGFSEMHFDYYACRRCDETGRVDFGSHPVPYSFTPYNRITVDETGKVVLEEQVIADARRGLIALRKRMRRPAA